MAWRFLERCVLDACQGEPKKRQKYISEMEVWAITDEGPDNPWSFSHWCTLLGVDEGFMAQKFMAFLMEQRCNAALNKRGDFKILRQIEAVRIDQPHQLALVIDSIPPSLPSRYRCLSCGHTGSWDDFLGYTCVRGQPAPPEAVEPLPVIKLAKPLKEGELDAIIREAKGCIDEESSSQPLNDSHKHPVQDQGSRTDPQLDNGDSQGGRPDGGGSGSPSGVGAVASGPAAGGCTSDVLRSIQALF